MSHVDTSPLSHYNSLSDPHLAGYFANTKMRHHLRRSGLISRRGEIVSQNSYRLNMARKEHKKHVKDLLAHAIVSKTLDLERHRQVAIRQKLEEIAKIELVQRVKDGRKHNPFDESLLPLITPRKGKASHDTGGQADRRTPGHRSGAQPEEDILLEEVVTYVDDDGNPVAWSEVDQPSGSRGRNRTPRGREEIDARHLYSLNPAALRRYATTLARMEQTNSLLSPYLMPQVPLPPSSPRTAPARGHRGYRGRSSSSDKSPKRSPGRDLHRKEPPMSHQGDIHSMCEVTMKYHGWALNLAREQMDPRQEVLVEQQHCGGNTLTVFRDLLVPGSTFTFTSKRHRGYPFSLTLYVDGRQDARVSTCCEMGHSKKVRLGGKQGHFSIVSIGKMSPCYKCQVQKGLKGGKAPPRKLKRPAKNEGEEVIVMETTPREKSTRKPDDAQPAEAESDSDDYEDDFDDEEGSEKEKEKEEPDEVLYDKRWEESEKGRKNNDKRGAPEETEDKRQIIGLSDDFEDYRGQKSATVAAEKSSTPTPSRLDDYEEDRNRKVEGYSSEEEDLDGEKSKTVIVEKKPDTPGKASTTNEREESTRPRVRTPPKHPRILSSTAQKKEESDTPKAKVEKFSSAPRNRTPSPPQEVQITIVQPLSLEEDRDADYSSSSESSVSSSSSSSEEEDEQTPRPVTQGQEDSLAKDKKTESEPEEASQETKIPSDKSSSSDSSLPPSSSSSSSSSSDTESKRTSLPERPKSPVAMTLEKQEEEEEQKNEPVGLLPVMKEVEESPATVVSEEVVTQEKVEELEASNQAPLPTESARSEPESIISRGGESASPRESSSSSSVSSSSSSSSSDTDEKTPRPVMDESPTQKQESTEEVKEDQKKSESSSSSSTTSSSSGSESERSTKEALPSEVTPEKTDADKKDSSSSESDSSSQHEAKSQPVIIATPPVIDPTADVVQAPAEASEHAEQVKEQEQAKIEESMPSEGEASGVDITPAALVEEVKEEVKKEDSTADTTDGVKKTESADSESVDSSTDSSSSSSSSSSDESESEGELIVQSDTPQSARTQQSDIVPPKTETESSARTEAEVTDRTDTEQVVQAEDSSQLKADVQSEADGQAEDEDKSRLPAPHATTQPEQTTEQSPPSTPPESPRRDNEQPLIPAVVVIPNTPDVSERVDGVTTPLEAKSGGLPDQFQYTPKHDSTSDEKATDDEGQQRLQSESEPENMAGGNDPDNVAENDSANWRGSMEFRGPPEQTTHTGSITPLLDGHDDIQINNINLTKSQLVELLQALEMNDTIHTLSISNANLGMEEMQMLLQSLAKSPAKPTVLNLNYNILGPSSVTTLVDILQIKPSIEMLLLHGNPIGNKGLQTLVDGLLDIEYEAQEYKKKESERVGGVPVTLPKGRFCQLQELDIGEASVTDEGMVDVALLLESNLELQTLSLSSSPDISQSGWNKLGASLAKNRKLKTLTLEHNKIGDVGMQVLAEGLQKNMSLNTLDLAHSGIGEIGGQAIVEFLKKNTTIVNLTLSPGNNIPEKIVEEIDRYLSLNKASQGSP